MTIVRVGSNRKFSEGWDKAFGCRKKATKAKSSVKASLKTKRTTPNRPRKP